MNRLAQPEDRIQLFEGYLNSLFTYGRNTIQVVCREITSLDKIAIKLPFHPFRRAEQRRMGAYEET